MSLQISRPLSGKRNKFTRAESLRKQQERVWVNSLKKKYNLTVEEYHAMVLAQQGKCDICGKESKRRLFVDHNHVTGEVRGLLCAQCNNMLGQGKDDPSILKRGAEYLEEKK